MNAWLLPSIIACLASSAILMVVFYFLYFQYREVYLRTWAAAWTVYALRFFFALTSTSYELNSHLLDLVDFCVLLSGLLLLRGTDQFLGRRTSLLWLAGGLAGTFWITLSHVIDAEFFYQALPVYLLYAASSIYTGRTLLGCKSLSGFGKHLTGWSLILWGLHKADYPFLRPVEWLAPWGFLAGSLFGLTVALGFLLTYFQKVRDDLAESEKRFKTIADYTYDIEFWTGPKGETRWINPTVERVTGYSVEECQTMIDFPLSIVHEDDAEKVRFLLDDAGKGTCGNDFSFRLCMKCGDYTWVAMSWQAILDADGVCDGFRASLRDVNQRKIFEEALQTTKEHYRVLLETNPHGVVECDTEGRITFANRSYVGMKGFPLEDIHGKPIWEMASFKESREEISRVLVHLKTSGGVASHVVRNLDSDGVPVWRKLDWNSIRDGAGEITGHILVVTDITEQKQALDGLEVANRALNTLFQAVPLPLVAVDLEKNVTRWNPAAEAVFGWPESEILGKFSPFLRSEYVEEFERYCRLTLGGGRVNGAEIRQKRKDGSDVDLKLYTSPLYDDKGEISGAIAIMEDITLHREVEAALRRSEKNYRNLVERSPFPMFVHESGRFVYLNPAASKIFASGESKSLEGKSIDDYVTDTGNLFVSDFRREREADDVRYYELMVDSPSRGEIDLEVTDIAINYGGSPSNLAICLDISERKAMIAELLKSEARYRAIVQDQTDFIARWKTDGTLTFVNGSLCRYYELASSDLIGKNLFALLDQKSRAELEGVLATLTSDSPLTPVINYALFSPATKGRYQEWQTRAIIDARGNISEYQSVGRDITERRQAQLALESQTKLLQTILDSIPAPIFYKDDKGVYLGCNVAFEKSLGFPREEIIGHTVYDVAPQDLAEIYHEADLRLMRQGGVQVYETSVLFADGLRHDVLFHKATFENTEDQSGGMVGSMLDITERKQMEELVFSIARGIAPDTGAPFFWNLVRSLSEALHADMVFVAECRSENTDNVRTLAVVSNGDEIDNFDYDLSTSPMVSVLKDGILLYAAHSSGVRRKFPFDSLIAAEEIEAFFGLPLLDSKGALQGILAILYRDPLEKSKMIESLLQIVAVRVSSEIERQKSQKILLESERRYRNLYEQFQTLLDGISDPLILVAPDHKLIWSNVGAGLSPEAKVETLQNCCALLECDEASHDACPTQKSFRTGVSETGQVVSKDGGIWEIRTFPIVGDDGAVSSVIEMRVDITEKVRMQKESARTGQLAALGELAAGVAHEINNPITGVINYAQILANRTTEESREYDISMRIIREGERIATIVGKLLAFARKGTDEKRLVAIEDVVTDALALSESQLHRSAILIDLAFEKELPKVLANYQQIQQVCLNMLSNARHALERRFPEYDERKSLRISGDVVTKGKEEWVKLSFFDQGCGIPEHMIAKVMNPFFTTKPSGEGTGLGLSISHDIVTDHGGYIDIESRQGEYTRVDILLPAYRREGNLNVQ